MYKSVGRVGVGVRVRVGVVECQLHARWPSSDRNWLVLRRSAAVAVVDRGDRGGGGRHSDGRLRLLYVPVSSRPRLGRRTTGPVRRRRPTRRRRTRRQHLLRLRELAGVLRLVELAAGRPAVPSSPPPSLLFRLRRPTCI